MFCTQCGAPLAADAKFCMQCGTAVVGAVAQAAPAVKAKPFSAEWFKEPQKYGKYSVPRYLILIVSVIVTVFGVMSMINGIGEIREGMGYQNTYSGGGYAKP